MATSYSINATTPKDKARLLLGDTGVDGTVFLLTDEEINSFLGQVPFNEGVALLAESLATRFAQYPDQTDTPGGSSIKWTERVPAWLELAKRMRAGGNPLASAPQRTMAKLGTLSNPPSVLSGVRGIRS
jgi:hypothetical protein